MSFNINFRKQQKNNNYFFFQSSVTKIDSFKKIFNEKEIKIIKELIKKS